MTVNDLTVCALLRARMDLLHETETVWRNATAKCVSTELRQPLDKQAGWTFRFDFQVRLTDTRRIHHRDEVPSNTRLSALLAGHAILQLLFTPHSAQQQCARTVRNSVHSQARSCNDRTSWRHSHYIHVGEDWYPFNTNIFQQQPDTQYSQASTNSQASSTLKQARTMNSTLKQEHSTQILKQDLARARTGIVNNCITIMIDILAFYNV